MTPTDFLAVQLGRHEAVARLALATAETGDDRADLTFHRDGVIANATYVLADVAAKRKVIQLHAPDWTRWKDQPACSSCGEVACCAEEWPCPTILALLQPYADLPDFDPAWRS